jgi:hypothetical protein
MLLRASKIVMDAALREQTEKVCGDLIGTKHDVVHEAFELDDLLESNASEERTLARIDFIGRLLHEDIKIKLHRVVKSIQAAGDTIAYVLVAESATDILNEYNRFIAAVDALRASASPQEGFVRRLLFKSCDAEGWRAGRAGS